MCDCSGIFMCIAIEIALSWKERSKMLEEQGDNLQAYNTVNKHPVKLAVFVCS